MKVTIFGGSGFLGSHVADCLTSFGHDVTIFDKTESQYLQPSQVMILGDMLDSQAVSDAVDGAEVVFNFAGQADIGSAIKNPTRTIETNIMGNTHILEACVQHKVVRYIFASTIYVYSAAGSFYRASKQACELIIESYHKEYDLDYTVLRYGSLYGPRADESNWIHSIVKQALTEKRIVRKGDGEEIREYIHVTDAARLTARMTEPEFANEYLIITGQQTIRIKDVLIMMREIMGNAIDIEYVPARNEGHYEITPYNFQPKFARKMTDNTHVDLGQGLIELLNMEHDQQTQANVSAMERV